jgi:hypothetical protein
MRFIATFHEFNMEDGMIWHEMYITVPLTVDKCQTHVKLTGFNGFMGSSDATHIVVEKCSFRVMPNSDA